jgi:hypothetical protein
MKAEGCYFHIVPLRIGPGASGAGSRALDLALPLRDC